MSPTVAARAARRETPPLVGRRECATIGFGRMPRRRDDNKDGDLGTIIRPQLDRETDTKKKVERPPLYEVLLHNDDYTTQEFVIYVLMKYFQHDATAARKIMLHVHTKGLGVAGVFPFEIAETKAHQVVAFARENEMPLQASLRKIQET
jgi:ATP-dependent Clp protease adaptor protein ClpS